MTDAENLKIQLWWMEQLKSITKKVMEAEEKRQKRIERKSADALADYSSREEIIDAYGYGMITEKQKDKLIDMWDNCQRRHDGLYYAKIYLLQDAYNDAKLIAEELGGKIRCE